MLTAALILSLISGGAAISCEIENPINGVANITDSKSVLLEDYKGTDSPFSGNRSLEVRAQEIISFSENRVVQPSEGVLEFEVPSEVAELLEDGDHLVIETEGGCGYSSMVAVDSQDGYIKMIHLNSSQRYDLGPVSLDTENSTETSANLTFNSYNFSLREGETYSFSSEPVDQITLLETSEPETSYIAELDDPRSPDIPGLGEIVRRIIQFLNSLVAGISGEPVSPVSGTVAE